MAIGPFLVVRDTALQSDGWACW